MAMDVIGLTFLKDIYVQVQQVIPAEPTNPQKPLTVLQEQLLHKLGDNAYPFTLQVLTPSPGQRFQGRLREKAKEQLKKGVPISFVCCPPSNPLDGCQPALFSDTAARSSRYRKG